MRRKSITLAKRRKRFHPIYPSEINFIAFAPDALFTLGGYPGDEDKARELFAKLDQAKVREDFLQAAATFKTLLEGNGKLGVVGFCFGGGIANFLATRIPDLAAAVPFYGAVSGSARIRCTSSSPRRTV